MKIVHFLIVLLVLSWASEVFADFRISLYDGLRQFRVSAPPEIGVETMTLTGSRNETVGLQAVLLNDSAKSIDKIKISAEGLPGISVRTYASAAIRVDRGSKQIEFPEDDYFDLLRPAGWETVAQKSFRPYWIDFAIAPDAEPGPRNGKLTFTSGGVSRAVSVRIEVSRAVLPVTPTLPLAFAFQKSWVEEFYGRKLTEDELFQCYETMLRHRLGPVPMWGGGAGFYNEKTVRFCRDRGMNVFLVSVSGMSDAAVDKSLAATKPRIDLLQRLGCLDKTYQFSFDEILMHADAEKKLPWMRKTYERFHEEYPGIKRLATSWPDKRLDDFTDIYVVPVGNYRAEMSEKKAVWWYSVGNARPDSSPDFRIDFPPMLQRYFFLVDWRAGIDGHLYWAAHREWPFNKDIRNKDRVEGEWVPSYSSAFGGRRKDDCGAGNLFYPGGKEYVSLPSVRAKYLRDGVNDYEYLAQLRAATERLQKKKPSGWEKFVREANDLLNFPPELEGPPEANHLGWKSQLHRAGAVLGLSESNPFGKSWSTSDPEKCGARVSITIHPMAVRNESGGALRVLPEEDETVVYQDVPVRSGVEHSASVHIKTDDLNGKAWLRLDYLDTQKKTIISADSEAHVSGSTGGKTFREITVKLPKAPENVAFLRIGLVSVLKSGTNKNDKPVLEKAFYDDVSATAGDQALTIGNPGFEDKYRFDTTQTARYLTFRSRLVDCLDRACALLNETGPFDNARPGRNR